MGLGLRRVLTSALVLGSAACSHIGTPEPGGEPYRWFGGSPEHYAGGALNLAWKQGLTAEYEGPYLPVEYASAALDPESNRLYIGSTAGELLAMTAEGRELYGYDAGAAIEAQPALDRQKGELYLASTDGTIHALRAEDGEVRWTASAGDPIGEPPLLTEDALYVVTDADRVVAMARKDGSQLWTYRRTIPEGFSISSHAGLTLAGGKLLTGFTDGVVAALDPADGSELWKRDTALDMPESEGGARRFRDVDTTPVVEGNTVYAASFSAGLYGLDLDSGSVRWRDADRAGVVSLKQAGPCLLVASAKQGVLCLNPDDRSVRWQHELKRGSPSPPRVARGMVLVGESEGSFLALSLQGGRELARIDTGNGFTAPASASGRRGFVLSNGGTLLSFFLAR
jgi:outer membrane protein assembly factor BamB